MTVNRGVLVPTMMYRSQCWIWQKNRNGWVNATKREYCVVYLVYYIMNYCRMEYDIVAGIEKGTLS